MILMTPERITKVMFGCHALFLRMAENVVRGMTTPTCRVLNSFGGY
jgi:hypothetical protein